MGSSPRPEGLVNILNSIPSTFQSNNLPSIIGQVVEVISGVDLPTPSQYNRANKVIGAVLYAEVNTNGPVRITGSLTDVDYNKYDIAYPISFQTSHVPLKSELVWIKKDFPSADAKVNKTAIKSYYLNVIGAWSSIQQNATTGDGKWLDFIQNPNVRPLFPFQGDYIVQGRQGSGLRFSTTSKVFGNLNEWSSVGNGTDPITILTNGFAFKSGSLTYTEQINKDLSSIYLTSAQSIPLQVDKIGSVNPLTNPIEISKYIDSQIIVNSDRIVLNSKKDEVMLFAKTNIELSTKNIINLNADERIHLNSGKIFLGTVNNTLPTEPLLLGDKTVALLSNMVLALFDLGCSLSAVVGSPEGAPALDVNTAGENLMNDLERIANNLNAIVSQQNFTA